MFEVTCMANRPLASVSNAFAPRARLELRSESALTGMIIIAGRVLFALVFLIAGPRLFQAGSAQAAAQHGLPLSQFFVPAAGVLALLGGLSILLGYRARIGAWMIAIFLLVVTPVMHNFWAVADPTMAQTQFVNFMKNTSMLGGALLITQFGGGPWSLDARRK
jgi:putative oxidoreductase